MLWSGRQFKTIGSFRSYLSGLPAPRWAKGVTIHHTWSPTIRQWRGDATMDGTRDYYANTLGWDRGPNLFLAYGTPTKANDGIWEGTPVTTSGIHAGTCNATHFGIEVVGNYDIAPWSAGMRKLIYSVADALMDWTGVGAVNEWTVRGHRECLPNKSCPGNQINMERVRLEFGIYRMDGTPHPPTEEQLPPGTVPVDHRFAGAWRDSGGVWRGPGLLSPGYAIRPAEPAGGGSYIQIFERSAARWLPDGNVEWLLLTEADQLLDNAPV